MDAKFPKNIDRTKKILKIDDFKKALYNNYEDKYDDEDINIKFISSINDTITDHINEKSGQLIDALNNQKIINVSVFDYAFSVYEKETDKNKYERMFSSYNKDETCKNDCNDVEDIIMALLKLKKLIGDDIFNKIGMEAKKIISSHQDEQKQKNKEIHEKLKTRMDSLEEDIKKYKKDKNIN